MRVVELDRGAVRQRSKIAVILQLAAQDVLQRRRDEEIFLAQAQLAAGRRVVARVQHLGDRLGAAPLRQGADMVAFVEDFEAQRIGCPGRP